MYIRSYIQIHIHSKIQFQKLYTIFTTNTYTYVNGSNNFRKIQFENIEIIEYHKFVCAHI